MYTIAATVTIMLLHKTAYETQSENPLLIHTIFPYRLKRQGEVMSVWMPHRVLCSAAA